MEPNLSSTTQSKEASVRRLKAGVVSEGHVENGGGVVVVVGWWRGWRWLLHLTTCSMSTQYWPPPESPTLSTSLSEASSLRYCSRCLARGASEVGDDR